MYRKVLVPLDKSKEAEKVLPIVEGIHAPGSEVVLLHVIPPAATQGMGRYRVLGSQQEETERFKAMSYLKGVVHQLGGDPERWRCEVTVSKSVAQGILDLAAREGVDLIAMYTHDRKGLAGVLKRSIATDVKRWAPVEVKVFKPQELTGPMPSEAADLGLKRRILKETDIFRSLSDTQIDSVASLAQRLRVPAGQALGTAGELGDRLFIVIEGDAQLSVHSAVGEITVRIAGLGESFALAALVGPGILITSGGALTDMQLLTIPRSPLIELCMRDPEIGMRIYSATADVFASRYSKTLTHLSINAERVLRGADFLEKVLEPRRLG